MFMFFNCFADVYKFEKIDFVFNRDRSNLDSIAICTQSICFTHSALANLDVGQYEVIQHLIDVTEVVAANSQFEKSLPRRNSKTKTKAKQRNLQSASNGGGGSTVAEAFGESGKGGTEISESCGMGETIGVGCFDCCRNGIDRRLGFNRSMIFDNELHRKRNWMI